MNYSRYALLTLLLTLGSQHQSTLVAMEHLTEKDHKKIRERYLELKKKHADEQNHASPEGQGSTTTTTTLNTEASEHMANNINTNGIENATTDEHDEIIPENEPTPQSPETSIDHSDKQNPSEKKEEKSGFFHKARALLSWKKNSTQTLVTTEEQLKLNREKALIIINELKTAIAEEEMNGGCSYTDKATIDRIVKKVDEFKKDKAEFFFSEKGLQELIKWQSNYNLYVTQKKTAEDAKKAHEAALAEKAMKAEDAKKAKDEQLKLNREKALEIINELKTAIAEEEENGGCSYTHKTTIDRIVERVSQLKQNKAEFFFSEKGLKELIDWQTDYNEYVKEKKKDEDAKKAHEAALAEKAKKVEDAKKAKDDAKKQGQPVNKELVRPGKSWWNLLLPFSSSTPVTEEKKDTDINEENIDKENESDANYKEEEEIKDSSQNNEENN